MLLPLQVAFTLLAFVAAAGLLLEGRVAAIAGYHTVFALGILPLILAAMAHFIPVLARSSRAPRSVRIVPPLAAASGLLLVLSFVFPYRLPTGSALSAILSGTLVVAFSSWALRLRRKCLGAPHPGLDWYLAALACLLIGLGAILAETLLPDQRPALRRLHLHMNLLGFVGITALGTLQVLLPTVARTPDPDAALRMRRHLKWLLAGTVATAMSAAWYPALSWIGLPLLAYPVLALLAAWVRRYRGQMLAMHGAAPALGAALLGFLAVLMLAAAHGLGYPRLNPIPAFIVAFLMPLVTGAASALLPVWIKPGARTDWHARASQKLGYGNGLRVAVFLGAGMTVGFGAHWGWWVALLGIGTFVLQSVPALRTPNSGALSSVPSGRR